MVKLHILGGPGSGKTTFAHAIAARFAVPHYDLDQLGRKHGPHAAPLVADMFAIAQQPGWVTEGIYLFFVEPLLQHANYVVLLDVGWPTAAWRIVRRHIAASMRGTNQYPGWNGWKALFNLGRYARRYYQNGRPDTTDAERTWRVTRSTTTELRTANDVIAYTEQHSALISPPTVQFVRQYLEPYHHKVVVVKNNADRARLLARIAKESADTLTIRTG